MLPDVVADAVAAGPVGRPGAAVLARAVAGSSGPWLDDAGHRRSPLTCTGAPVELKVGADGATAATAVAGMDLPWFVARCEAEAEARVAVAPALGPAADLFLAASRVLVDACLPDPAIVDPRRRLASHLGLAWSADGLLSGLRTYCTLRADPDAPARVAAAVPGATALLASLDAPGLAPSLAAVEVERTGKRTTRLYSRLAGDDPGPALDRAATALGLSHPPVDEALDGLGLDRPWLSGALVGVRRGFDAAHRPAGDGVAVYPTSRLLGAPARRWEVARRLAASARGSGTMAATLDRLDPRRWEVNLVALHLHPDPGRATIYLAPSVMLGR